jgi:Tfp pilus assembly protein PilO
MKKFNKRERYFILFCIICISMYLSYKFVYLSLAQSYRYKQIRIDTLETKYISHREMAAQSNSINKTLALLRKDLMKVESRFFPPGKESLVAALIQQDIEQICMHNGIKLHRSAVLKTEKIGSYNKISIQVIFKGSITAFNRIVFALKNRQKYLSIPEVEIRVTARRNTKTIMTTMTVYGIMRI